MNTLLIVGLTILCLIALLFVVGRLPERFAGAARQWFNILDSPLGSVAVVITLGLIVTCVTG